MINKLTINDIKGNWRHDDEGAHWACDSRLKNEGGNARCCECAAHKGCDALTNDKEEETEWRQLGKVA